MSIKDEKDRFGDKLRDVERAREDQYFAERDRALLDKIRRQQESGAGEERGGCCPKCSTRLRQATVRGVQVDECPGCGGLWLDKGELEAIAKSENDGWIARWLRNELGG